MHIEWMNGPERSCRAPLITPTRFGEVDWARQQLLLRSALRDVYVRLHDLNLFDERVRYCGLEKERGCEPLKWMIGGLLGDARAAEWAEERMKEGRNDRSIEGMAKGATG